MTTDVGLDDPLEDFRRETFTAPFFGPLEGVDATKTVLVSGSGPAVIVLAEMPGISPHVARFARWVRDAGFTVHLPSLFGRDGAYPRSEEGLAILKRACVSAEFRALAANTPTPVTPTPVTPTPVTQWLCALARHAHLTCGGPGVGAIGMCFTGNFALGMMLEPAVRAPVMCQPSLPLNDLGAIQLREDEAAAIRARLESEDLTVLGFRFAGDRFCTAERFARYREALGPRFLPTVVPTEAAHPAPPPFFRDVVASPHSVVTAHLIDEAGQPTLAARDAILAFLSMRLHGEAR